MCKKERTIYALGFFDGVHLGHQALLQACRELAQKNGCKAGVVTFTSHPDTLVLGQTPGLINTTEDRKRLLLSMGIDTVIELPFDKQLMTMPWQDFFRMLLETYHAAGLVCGDDFRFGHKGEGNALLLKEACRNEDLPCVIVPEQLVDGVRVSSTHIRRLLEQGDLETANRFLGHPHSLTGKVISGRGLGHTIGIPTANLLLPEQLVVPKLGVYACKAIVDCQEYLAVTNIGSRPTVGGHQLRAESWLLDFEDDLYGKTLTLTFHKFLRAEKKFSDLEELREEILKNAAQTRKLLENS